MKEEIRIFFTAMMFYTRIPCPSWVDHSPEYINKSVRYFPLIGWIVGGLSFLFLYLGAMVDPYVGAIGYLGFSAILTGAFHEDGFADVCDGFGGGWNKTQILNIMKDSRVGTYAVVGLLLLMLMKIRLLVVILEEQPSIMLLAIIVLTGHGLSRWGAATIIFTHEYVREDEKSKAKPVAKSFSTTNVLVSSFLGLIPVLGLVWVTKDFLYLGLIPMVYLLKMYLASWFKKKIGGYTGDCLGAAQQICEVFIYFLFALHWSFT